MEKFCKLFKTVNNGIIRECCSYLKFPLPSELVDKRKVKFQFPKQFYAMYCIILASRHTRLTC